MTVETAPIIPFADTRPQRCSDCGYQTQTGVWLGSYCIKVGDVKFTGCPNCLGKALEVILGKTHFGNMEPLA